MSEVKNFFTSMDLGLVLISDFAKIDIKISWHFLNNLEIKVGGFA